MNVQCVICDTIETLDYDCPEAKKLRNRRVHMYLCQTCHDRITVNTKERHSTGQFQVYNPKKKQTDLI